MNIIPQVSKSMKRILNEKAEKISRETNFVKRESKLTGPLFAQITVFGWLSDPDASLNDLSQTAAIFGLEITAQGIDKRFNQDASEFLRELLMSAVEEVIVSNPVSIAVLERFSGVYIGDSSTIKLPDILMEQWKGCGGLTSKGTSSAIKLQVVIDFKSGRLYGPLFQHGREHDQSGPLHKMELPVGSLSIKDLGYYSLKEFNRLHKEGKYWLSRFKVGTNIYDESSAPIEIDKLLKKQKTGQFEMPIILGEKFQIPSRLIAEKIPEKERNKRRGKLRREARRKRQAVSEMRLKLAAWNIYITNAPEEFMPIEAALVLIRVRWQIELLFKLWKSYGKIDEWRTENHWRILCELYAKLLAMVIQHWLFLTSCWVFPDKSLFKAAKTVKKLALYLALSFISINKLELAIMDIKRALETTCRINKRKKEPSTFQLLLALSEEGGLG